MIGKIAGHYRILERLGEGGMGEVYLAEDLRLKRKAAIKLIASHLTRDETRRLRFLQEATLAASIDHPHIAKIYDIDQVEDRTFIAMEYVRGRTLREVLKNGPLPSGRAIELAVQIAEALAKVHEHGIVHRDLKPENVLISEDGYAKVIDFGLAKLSEPLTSANVGDAVTASQQQVRTADGLILGTVAYMSPEQARGETVDARSDIFSFGGLLYEMLTGAAVFRRSSTAETLSAILTEAVPAVSIGGVAPESEVQRIVRKCLVKDAGARYQTMRDVVVDLRYIRASLSSTEHTVVVPVPAPSRWTKRHVWMAAAAAVMAAILITTTVWMRNGTTFAPASGATAKTTRPAIAVLNFQNVSGAAESAWLSKGLPSMLVTGLAQTPQLEVLTPDRLNEAALQIGQASFDAVEPGRFNELARRAGATVVVNGSIIQAGDEFRIDARVEDLAAGRVLLPVTVRGKDPLALADDLASQIRRGLDVRAEGEVRRVADMTSSSVEAYRLYTLGVQARRNNRRTDAKKLLDQAVALDPSFAMAYLELSRVARDNGKPEEQREQLRQAAQHIERLAEKDALFVRADVAESERQTEEALRHYETLMSKYPEEMDAYSNAAYLQDTFTKRAAILQRGVRAVPSAGELYNGLGYTLIYDNRFDEGIAALENYVRLRPNEHNALDSLAEGYMIIDDLPKSIETYTRAIAAGHGRGGRAWAFAVVGRYDEAFQDFGVGGSAKAVGLAHVGRYREAFETLEKAKANQENNKNSTRVALMSSVSAALELERGNCSAVTGRSAGTDQTLSALPPDAFSGLNGGSVVLDLLIGTCDARSGRLDAAKRRLEHARGIYQEPVLFQRFWFHSLEGEIALAGRDYAHAVPAFAGSEPPKKMPSNVFGDLGPWSLLANSVFPRDGVARARIAQGQIDEAIAIYRSLLTPNRESKFTAFFEPRYILAIARLLDRKGQKDEARQEYRRFLEYWKNADPGLPELAEARRGAS